MGRSNAELLLATQLEQADIAFRREYAFAEAIGRKWRADFVIASRTGPPPGNFLVEVEGGSFGGGHKRGLAYESDCDKHNAAMMLGWKVLRFTPQMVEDGRALEVIRQALDEVSAWSA